MYLILKPLVIRKVFNERVRNYCRSNEFIKMDVITGGQNFLIDGTGLFCHGNRSFDNEWRKNNSLTSYSGELIIYKRGKINPEDLIKQKIGENAIGKIQDFNFENSLYFEVFLDDDSFESLDRELSFNIKNISNIGVSFDNPSDETENVIEYQSFSEYGLNDSHIEWKIANKDRHNYLVIDDINFSFNRLDIENQFYDFQTPEERKQTERENEDSRLQQSITAAIDNSNINYQVNAMKDQIFELQLGLSKLKKSLIAGLICYLLIVIFNKIF